MANVDPHIFFAFAVEGLGDTSSTSPSTDSNGWLITGSGARAHIDTIEGRTSWTVKPWVVDESVDLSGSSLELFTSGVTWSTMSCQLQAVDEAAETFVATQFRAQATLENRLTASATTIDLSRSDLADTVIFVGNETIRLKSATGTTSGVTTYNCVRGQYKSLARAHEAESPIFTDVPFFDARRVWVYRVYVEPNSSTGASDPDIEIVQSGLAQMVGNVTQDQGALSVDTRSVGMRLKEIRGGKGDRLLRGELTVSDTSSGGLALGGNPTEGGSRILKPEVGDVPKGGAFQIDDYAWGADVNVDTSTTPNSADSLSPYFTPSSVAGGPEGIPLWGEQPGFDDIEPGDFKPGGEGPHILEKTVGEEVYEIFAVDRDAGVNPLHAVGDALGEVFRYHRLSFFAAITQSTAQKSADASSFDVLTREWSLNCSWAFTDSFLTDIKELIRATPDATVDRIALGKNNEPVDLWDFCVNDLLTPIFTLNVTSEGLLDVDRVRPPTIEDHDEAVGRPVKPRPSSELREDPARDRTKYGAQVTVGKTELTDGRSVQIRNDKNLNQRWLDYEGSRELSISWSVASPSRAVRLGTGDDDTGGTVAGYMKDNLQLQAFPNPRIHFLTDDNRDKSADYTLGEFVNLDDFDLEPEWIVDSQGNRINNFSDIDATGVVVRRKLFINDEERSTGYVLGVMFVGDGLTRWRAPSGKIQASTTVNSGSDTQLTLEADDGSKSHYGAQDLSGNAVSDASFFTVGDETEIRNPDFTEWTDNALRTVKSVDAANNTITVAGTYTSLPPAGRFVELARLDSNSSGTGYENTTILTNIDRAYIYLADVDDTIGDGQIEADKYGA